MEGQWREGLGLVRTVMPHRDKDGILARSHRECDDNLWWRGLIRKQPPLHTHADLDYFRSSDNCKSEPGTVRPGQYATIRDTSTCPIYATTWTHGTIQAQSPGSWLSSATPLAWPPTRLTTRKPLYYLPSTYLWLVVELPGLTPHRLPRPPGLFVYVWPRTRSRQPLLVGP